MPATNGAPDPATAAFVAERAEHTGILRSILSELRAEVLQIAVGDVIRRELTMDNFPVAGAKRVIARRTGNGWDQQAVPTTGILLLGATEGRLGGTIINIGQNPIILYLAAQQQEGCVAIYLTPGGGAWDFRLGNLLWVGHVFAVAQTAASVVCGGEV